MKYEMPALTAEQRELCIDEATKLIKALRPGSYGYHLSQIALASLTSEPVELDNWNFTGLLFQSPPVQALKRIELNSDDVDKPIDWYAGSKTRDMVIDVIRAAGYEVKE